MVDASEQHLRAARVEGLKREIAAGTYETADKLEAALDAFLDDVEQGRVTPGEDGPRQSRGQSDSPNHPK